MKSKIYLSITFSFLLCAIFSACLGNDSSSETSTLTILDQKDTGSTSASATPIMLGELKSMNVTPDKEKLHPIEVPEYFEGVFDVCADEDGTEYRFAKETGEYRGFFKPNVKASKPEISEKEAQAIGDATAAMFVDISRYDHRVILPQGGYSQGIEGGFQISGYDFDCRKIMSGFQTTEGISVMMLKDGTVIAVTPFNIGKFDGLAEPEIDEKKIDANFLNEVQKQFGVDDVVKIYDRVLECEDSQFFMRYDFELSIQHGRKQIMIPV